MNVLVDRYGNQRKATNRENSHFHLATGIRVLYCTLLMTKPTPIGASAPYKISLDLLFPPWSLLPLKG